MTLIRFKDDQTEDDGLGLLLFENVPLKSWKNGETAVPDESLALLDREGIAYEVLGRATYEHLTPIRDLAAQKVE